MSSSRDSCSHHKMRWVVLALAGGAVEDVQRERCLMTYCLLHREHASGMRRHRSTLARRPGGNHQLGMVSWWYGNAAEASQSKAHLKQKIPVDKPGGVGQTDELHELGQLQDTFLLAYAMESLMRQLVKASQKFGPVLDDVFVG
jgi:hypothetical protein